MNSNGQVSSPSVDNHVPKTRDEMERERKAEQRKAKRAKRGKKRATK